MKISPPSLGFVYVLLVLAGIAWLFAFLARTPWYEDTGRAKDLGRAAYLERIAPEIDTVRRQSWLGTALGIYIQHEEWTSVLRLLEQHKQYNLVPTARGISELSQDEMWSFNLSSDKWTTGHQLARFLVYNPNDELQHYAFHWRTKGPGKGSYDAGDGEFHRFDLVGDDWKEARVEVKPIAAKGFGVYQFRANRGFALPGDTRRLGMQLDRIEMSASR